MLANFCEIDSGKLTFTFKKNETSKEIKFSSNSMCGLLVSILKHKKVDIDLLTSILQKKKIKKDINELTDSEKGLLIMLATNINTDVIFDKVIKRLKVNFNIIDAKPLNLIINIAIKTCNLYKLNKILENMDISVSNDNRKYFFIIMSISSGNIKVINIVINKFFSQDIILKNFFLNNKICIDECIDDCTLKIYGNIIFDNEFLENFKNPDRLYGLLSIAIKTGEIDILEKILEVFYDSDINIHNMIYYIDLAINSESIEIVGRIFITCNFIMDIDIVNKIVLYCETKIKFNINKDIVCLKSLIIIENIIEKIRNQNNILYSLQLKEIWLLTSIQYTNKNVERKIITNEIIEVNKSSLTLDEENSIKYITSKLYRDDIDSFLDNKDLLLILDLCNYTGIIDTNLIKNAHELYLTNCQNITNINELCNVNVLDISNCNGINDVSGLYNVKRLNLSQCENVEDISMLGNVYDLYLYKCNKIKDVSKLDNVTHLFLSNCNKIVGADSLKNVILL